MYEAVRQVSARAHYRSRLQAHTCVVTLVSRGSLIVAEAIVIMITWTKMHNYVKMTFSTELPLTISRIMFFDGTPYLETLDRLDR